MNYSPYEKLDLAQAAKQATQPQQFIAGTEGFDNVIVADEDFHVSDAYKEEADKLRVPMFGHPEMDMDPRCPKQVSIPMIRTGDGRNFRIYMKNATFITAQYLNNLCRFLDSVNEQMTVTFILGVDVPDEQTHLIGPIISAIQSCKAKVYTLAAGYCSIPETIIWCFGSNPKILRYGALRFGVTEIIKIAEKYKHYFEVFFKRAQQLQILTAQQVADIFEKNMTYMITYNDYQKLMNPV